MTDSELTAAAIVRHHLKSPEERIAACDRNIAAALLESEKSHTQAEHLQILLLGSGPTSRAAAVARRTGSGVGMRVHIDSFEAVATLKGESLTYENLKAAVLRAGKFSVFEATATAKHAKLYTQLNNDLEIELDNESVGFPWTLVKKRLVPLCAECRGLGKIERQEMLNKRNFIVHMDACPSCSGATA